MIEVTHKKVHFLQEVIAALGLTDCFIEPIDWRTFLRKTEYSTQIICARASLQPEELVRMFNASSVYKNAQLVYWAAQDYVPSVKVSGYAERSCHYVVGKRKRFLQFFKRAIV